MIGNKLHNLINELSVSQTKILIHRCSISLDKRMPILKTFILEEEKTIESLNRFLEIEVEKTWPNSNKKEKELKERRLSSYYSEQIEKIILETFLDKNSSIKNLLLAEAIEKNGNLNIINHYYDKAYFKALEEEDFYFQLLSLKGKIRMHYASQNEKELEKALLLNEELLKVLRHTNNDKITEYYYNVSNIFLEKNSLVRDLKEKYETEIKNLLKSIDYPLNQVSLYVSLAKLNFDNEQLDGYFEKAKEILHSVKNKNKDYFDLERKIRFLELRLNFFSGKDLNYLLEITEDIMKDSKAFSIINNNTLFYKILFLILNDQIDEANEILNETHNYFKANGKILEEFLQALIYEKTGEYKKAMQLLQPLMYTTNYFFAIFSRLLVIKIHQLKANNVLTKSIIDSTARLVKINSGNPLGKEANEFVLKYFKKYPKLDEKINVGQIHNFTELHRYILS